MIVVHDTRIIVDPHKQKEYIWWTEHKKELIEEGYTLEESSGTWIAVKSELSSYELEE